MSSFLKIEWIIRSSAIHAIKRPCGRCGVVRFFVPTGKFRLNANGKLLDAWLIYKCRHCGNRWNRTLFERMSVAGLPKDQVEALQSNDSLLAERIAREISSYKDTRATDTSAAFTIEVLSVDQSPDCKNATILTIRNPERCNARLDQVLSRGLDLSRREVLRLAGSGLIRVRNASDKALRRRIGNTMVIEFLRCTKTDELKLFEKFPGDVMRKE